MAGGDASGGPEVPPEVQWAELQAVEEEVLVTEDLLSEAKRAFGRNDVLYLHHVLAVAYPQLPTSNAAKKAIRRGNVRVDGVQASAHDAAAPPPSARLTVRVGVVDCGQAGSSQRLQAWNAKSLRPEAQVRVLFEDRDAGWAVVNKPAGLHCRPCCYSKGRMTLEAYLRGLLPPPRRGTRCRGPRVCHRLDFRVSGPVVVATTEEAMRAIKRSFEQRTVKKEYRAICCGAPGEVGEAFTVDAPLDGEACHTDVRVLRTAPCPHFGVISELALHPVTGRHQQLRRHCAKALGTPIVNEERALFEAAAPEWLRRTGAPLPPYVTRGGGNLFLQALQVAVPAPQGGGEAIVVRAEFSERFERLMRTAARAWQEGWRMDDQGQTYRVAEGQVGVEEAEAAEEAHEEGGPDDASVSED